MQTPCREGGWPPRNANLGEDSSVGGKEAALTQSPPQEKKVVTPR